MSCGWLSSAVEAVLATSAEGFKRGVGMDCGSDSKSSPQESFHSTTIWRLKPLWPDARRHTVIAFHLLQPSASEPEESQEAVYPFQIQNRDSAFPEPIITQGFS